MNLTLVKKLVQHDDLCQLLKRVRNKGQNSLITVHQSIEEICHVLKRVKKDGEHRWWETLVGCSPTAMGIYSHVLHPAVILSALVLLCLLLVVVLYARLWAIIKHLEGLQEFLTY